MPPRNSSGWFSQCWNPARLISPLDIFSFSLPFPGVPLDAYLSAPFFPIPHSSPIHKFSHLRAWLLIVSLSVRTGKRGCTVSSWAYHSEDRRKHRDSGDNIRCYSLVQCLRNHGQMNWRLVSGYCCRADRLRVFPGQEFRLCQNSCFRLGFASAVRICKAIALMRKKRNDRENSLK